jgi:hypothetical protein
MAAPREVIAALKALMRMRERVVKCPRPAGGALEGKQYFYGSAQAKSFNSPLPGSLKGSQAEA